MASQSPTWNVTTIYIKFDVSTTILLPLSGKKNLHKYLKFQLKNFKDFKRPGDWEVIDKKPKD
jgi:hypothetical protein